MSMFQKHPLHSPALCSSRPGDFRGKLRCFVGVNPQRTARVHFRSPPFSWPRYPSKLARPNTAPTKLPRRKVIIQDPRPFSHRQGYRGKAEGCYNERPDPHSLHNKCQEQSQMAFEIHSSHFQVVLLTPLRSPCSITCRRKKYVFGPEQCFLKSSFLASKCQYHISCGNERVSHLFLCIKSAGINRVVRSD